MSHPTCTAEEQWICYCLRVSEARLRAAVSCGAVESLDDVFSVTGAGSGCTACHRRIGEILVDLNVSPAERGCEVLCAVARRAS